MGLFKGDDEGELDVGLIDGDFDGLPVVGDELGNKVDFLVVVCTDDIAVGSLVGFSEGCLLGPSDGLIEGLVEFAV